MCAARGMQVRFQSLTDKSVLEAEPELFIHMQPDKTNNTLTIRDSGVGMTKADLVNNLGAPPRAAQYLHAAARCSAPARCPAAPAGSEACVRCCACSESRHAPRSAGRVWLGFVMRALSTSAHAGVQAQNKRLCAYAAG